MTKKELRKLREEQIRKLQGEQAELLEKMRYYDMQASCIPYLKYYTGGIMYGSCTKMYKENL